MKKKKKKVNWFIFLKIIYFWKIAELFKEDWFLIIDMARSDKTISISQNIRKKAYGPWKSYIQNNWCKNVFV